jgi:hypothetical protein
MVWATGSRVGSTKANSKWVHAIASMDRHPEPAAASGPKYQVDSMPFVAGQSRRFELDQVSHGDTVVGAVLCRACCAAARATESFPVAVAVAVALGWLGSAVLFGLAPAARCPGPVDFVFWIGSEP